MRRDDRGTLWVGYPAKAEALVALIQGLSRSYPTASKKAGLKLRFRLKAPPAHRRWQERVVIVANKNPRFYNGDILIPVWPHRQSINSIYILPASPGKSTPSAEVSCILGKKSKKPILPRPGGFLLQNVCPEQSRRSPVKSRVLEESISKKLARLASTILRISAASLLNVGCNLISATIEIYQETPYNEFIERGALK